MSVNFDKDGGKMVSGGRDGIVKVWEITDQQGWEPFDKMKKTRFFWKTTKTERWWRHKVTGEERRSNPGLSAVFEPECASQTIKVWDSGAFPAQIAPPWPNLTIPGFPGRYTRAKEREDERAQPPHLLCLILARREQNCVWIQ